VGLNPYLLSLAHISDLNKGPSLKIPKAAPQIKAVGSSPLQN